MAKPNGSFDQEYLQSVLLQSGIRFDFNVVDTVCRRRLNLSWSISLLLEVLLLCAGLGILPGNLSISLDGGMGTNLYLLVLTVLSFYLVWYALRLSYFLRLRQYLRKDQAPIVVEAYAVVCLDAKRRPLDNWWCAFWGSMFRSALKYAVVYKEVGTNQPRFFLSEAVSHRRLHFVPEQIGRVFIHRKNSRLYSLDDKSAYSTVSKKKYFAEQVFSNVSMSQRSVSDEKESVIVLEASNTSTDNAKVTPVSISGSISGSLSDAISGSIANSITDSISGTISLSQPLSEPLSESEMRTPR